MGPATTDDGSGAGIADGSVSDGSVSDGPVSDRSVADRARRLADAALDAARAAGSAVVVAVVDAGGHLVHLHRMDGVPFVLTEVATGKAYTAAAFGRPTDAVMQIFAERVQFTTSVQVATQGRFTLAKGGLPLRIDGTIVGGFAVSGGTGEEDLALALAALEAANAFDPAAPSG